jgi:hypothetical protein
VLDDDPAVAEDAFALAGGGVEGIAGGDAGAAGCRGLGFAVDPAGVLAAAAADFPLKV